MEYVNVICTVIIIGCVIGVVKSNSKIRRSYKDIWKAIGEERNSIDNINLRLDQERTLKAASGTGEYPHDYKARSD